MNKLIFSIDVEEDLHTRRNEGITLGLKRFEKLCDKYRIKPVLFVAGSSIKNNKKIFTRLGKKGWEISLHGYSHSRIDTMSRAEKEYEIRKSLEVFQKYLKIKPKGFRAPQHSIDDEMLDILEKYGFEYDSSYTPFNLLQLIFFPKRVFSWLKLCFSRPNPYNIRPNLGEIPIPSLLLPPVSLVARVFPRWFLRIYFSLLLSLFKQPVFYAHSWDFIKLEKSKIDKMFPHDKFIEKLEYIMKFGRSKAR